MGDEVFEHAGDGVAVDETLVTAALLSGLRLGVVALSEDRHVILVNQAFCDTFYLNESPDDLVGRTAAELAQIVRPHFRDHGEIFDNAEQRVDERSHATDEVLMLNDGRILERTFLPIESESGRRGYVWLHDDVTDWAVAARTLANQNEQLHELDRARADWVATVSHELRSPITAIAGSADLLASDAALDANTRELIDIVQRNAERLSRVVDDLLAVAELQGEAPTLSLAPVDVAALCQRVVASVSLHPHAARLTIDVDVAPGPPLLGDGNRLAQLLDNLLANAVKFTPEGGSVRLCAAPRTDHWLIEVTDTGIGIPADDVPLLFRRFARASNARTNQIPGTGLGLAIAQMIADLHEATLEVDSVEGVGTTFRLRLPLPQS